MVVLSHRARRDRLHRRDLRRNDRVRPRQEMSVLGKVRRTRVLDPGSLPVRVAGIVVRAEALGKHRLTTKARGIPLGVISSARDQLNRFNRLGHGFDGSN